MKHEKFNYNSLDEIIKRADELQIKLPFSDDISLLFKPIDINGRTINNRIVYQPMEGNGCSVDGTIGELTKRKYKRFAQGGPGIIWYEAVALTPEGKAKPGQLCLEENNVDEYKRHVEEIKETCIVKNGFEPVIIIQATHSGRRSSPDGTVKPVVAYNNPLFEKNETVDADCIITDDRLKELEEMFIRGAELSRLAGFDGYDIKACHGYLMSELLSAYNREGDYGGSFENRTRFLVNTAKAVNKSMPKDFIVTTRLNIYDGFPYPYGFGVPEDGSIDVDLTEPIKLMKKLHNDCGMEIVNVTMGNVYVNPHVTRPYNAGKYIPDEHPLVGIDRLINSTMKVQKEIPTLKIVASGLSFLQVYSANLAAGMLNDNGTSFVGFGREILAYPDFPQDLRKTGEMIKEKICVTCGQCSVLLRSGKQAGCTIRDKEYYIL